MTNETEWKYFSDENSSGDVPYQFNNSYGLLGVDKNSKHHQLL